MKERLLNNLFVSPLSILNGWEGRGAVPSLPPIVLPQGVTRIKEMKPKYYNIFINMHIVSIRETIIILTSNILNNSNLLCMEEE